jgi:Cu(I)/Ag(I) efflux system periplasmic protein CusF
MMPANVAIFTTKSAPGAGLQPDYRHSTIETALFTTLKEALMKPIPIAFVCLAALFAHPVIADDAHHAKRNNVVLAQAASMSEAEVRKVDKDAKKITLKHGPIGNLDMPAMTMVFHVADPAMLGQVKAGDKVKFSADKVGGNYTVTKIEAAK